MFKELEDKNFQKKLNETLKNGGVIAFVTDTVWGVGCLPENAAGVEKIYSLKGRERSKPLILMSNSEENLFPYVKNIPDMAKKLMEKHFPGALTLIFEKSEKTPAAVTSGKNTVGIRVPNNDVFKRLCEIIDGHVLATTSANRSNQPSAKNYGQAVEFVGDSVDMVIKSYGVEAKGLESTVALAIDEIKVLRQGEVVVCEKTD